MSALLDWLATQPEQQLDAAGDPRAGMTGASYAGGIELVSAGIDRRIDAIAPSIAWHSLLTALYRDDLVKGGWAAALSRARHPHRDGARHHQPGGRPDGDRRPAHHLGAHRGPRHRPPVRRGPRLVREPRPRRRARLADPRADAARAGDGRHAVHAQRGDPQLRAAEGQRRARAHAVVLRRARRVPDAGRQQPRRGSHRGLAAALADGRPRRRLRSDLRVAGRRRPVAQRARLAAARRPGHDRPGLGHADLQPGRHGVLGPRRGRHAVAQRRQRGHPVARAARRRGRRAEARARLPGHRDRPARLRLRPDRRRAAPPRARQPGHADRDQARRPAALGLALAGGRRRGHRPRRALHPADRRAARASTGRCAPRAASR